jgi:hypothetical protein
MEIFENPEHSKAAWASEVPVRKESPSIVINAELRSIENGELCVIVRFDKKRFTAAFEMRTEFASVVPIRVNEFSYSKGFSPLQLTSVPMI